jgi:hypothetical protein
LVQSPALPRGFFLHLQVDDVDAWWVCAVDAGAEVAMPLEKMFWGDRWASSATRPESPGLSARLPEPTPRHPLSA